MAATPTTRHRLAHAWTSPLAGAALCAVLALPVAGVLVAGWLGDLGPAARAAGGLTAFLVMGAVAGFSVSGST